MTKQAALQDYLSGFMPAYPENNVPHSKDLTFPYMTYENTIGSEGDAVSITADLWFKTTSERIPNRKVEEISESLSHGGKLLAFDGGAMWVKRGTPWCMALQDDQDNNIQRRTLNLEIEYL